MMLEHVHAVPYFLIEVPSSLMAEFRGEPQNPDDENTSAISDLRLLDDPHQTGMPHLVQCERYGKPPVSGTSDPATAP